MWYKGLIFKLKESDFSGVLLRLLKDILSDRKQRQILNDQNSLWAVVKVGVSQGSIFGSLLFLIYNAQKMKFSIKNFFIKCDQILRKLRIWSHLLKKSLMENFFFCAVIHQLFAR